VKNGPVQLPITAVVNGRTWRLFGVDFTTADGEFVTYIYALSFEHATAIVEELKQTARLGASLPPKRLRHLLQHACRQPCVGGMESSRFCYGTHRRAEVNVEVAMRQAREALAWYAYEAMACDRHTGSGRHEATQALLATVSVLALDAGRRANAAIEALHAAESSLTGAPTGEKP
jgi:hypothetical protein